MILNLMKMGGASMLLHLNEGSAAEHTQTHNTASVPFFFYIESIQLLQRDGFNFESDDDVANL